MLFNGLILASGTQDTDPDPFSFTDISGQDVSDTVFSDVVFVTGITGAVDVAISSGAFSINGGTYITEGKIRNGESLQLSATSSSSFLTGKVVTVTVGDYSTDWVVTTKEKDITPDAFSLSSVTNASPNGTYTVASNKLITGLEPNSTVLVTFSASTTGEQLFYYDGVSSIEVATNTAVSIPTSATGSIQLTAVAKANSSYGSTSSFTLQVGDVSKTAYITTRLTNTTAFPLYFSSEIIGLTSASSIDLAADATFSTSDGVPTTVTVESNNAEILVDADQNGTFATAENTTRVNNKVYATLRINISNYSFDRYFESNTFYNLRIENPADGLGRDARITVRTQIPTPTIVSGQTITGFGDHYVTLRISNVKGGSYWADSVYGGYYSTIESTIINGGTGSTSTVAVADGGSVYIYGRVYISEYTWNNRTPGGNKLELFEIGGTNSGAEIQYNLTWGA